MEVSKRSLLISVLILCLLALLYSPLRPRCSDGKARKYPPPLAAARSNLSEADYVHVGLVCVGKCPTFRRTVLTLLHYSTRPVTIHLIGDATCLGRLRELIAPPTRHIFYEWRRHADEVRWVANGHYSGVYGLLKLLAPKIVAPVARVIVLDTDLVFNADVARLWALFDRFGPGQMIGIGPNLSEWYLDPNRGWPAPGRGYNTGLMLMDARKLREAGWDAIWRAELKEPLARLGRTELGDQDVMNTVAVARPGLFYELPCTWNVQWKKIGEMMCLDRGVIDVLHWNRPSKHVADRAQVQPEVLAVLDEVERLGLT